MRNKAVFIDRDGTINEEVGHLADFTRFKFHHGSIQAIHMFNDAGYKVVVITNQAGVAKGYFTEEMVDQIHEHMKAGLSREGAQVDAIYYCVHHPEFGSGEYKQACSCRKPEPGMILQASKDLDIDLTESFMVGDTAKDIIAGRRAGCKTILVLTGHGAQEKDDVLGGFSPDFIAKNLLDAANWILQN